MLPRSDILKIAHLNRMCGEPVMPIPRDSVPNQFYLDQQAKDADARMKRRQTQLTLMLDGLSAAGIAKYMGEGLKRKVDLITSVEEAAGILKENPRKYAGIIVEPFLYYNKLGKIKKLQNFMISAKKNKDLSVVIYSTQDEKIINEEFHLASGIHYDSFVSKSEEKPIEKIRQSIYGYNICLKFDKHKNIVVR